MKREYSVEETNDLRKALENKYLFGFYSDEKCNQSMSSRAYLQAEKDKEVEDRLRTHMLAGHTAEDLIKSEA